MPLARPGPAVDEPRVRAWSTTRPLDLAVLAVLVLAALAAALGDAPGYVRVPLGLLFILACPGYAFIAALYPERHAEATEDGLGRRGLQPLERTALSLGLSIAIVPLLGLALNYTPFGIRLVPVLLTVAAFTLLCAAVAAWRRLWLPSDERFELRVAWTSVPWSSRRPMDKALSVALVLAVLFAAGSLAYVLATPRQGERFTEFYILGPTGKASCYPAVHRDGAFLTAEGDEDCPALVGNVTLGIVNHEGRDTTYWVRLVWTQETRLADNTTRVEAAQEARTWTVHLPHRNVDLSLDASFRPQHEESIDLPDPPWPGTVRLSFQLFLEQPPTVGPSPDLLESPYRRLHLWVEAEDTAR
jgi:uncharacterized membrane protein